LNFTDGNKNFRIFNGYGGCDNKLPDNGRIEKMPETAKDTALLILEILHSECDRKLRRNTLQLFDKKIVKQDTGLSTFMDMNHKFL